MKPDRLRKEVRKNDASYRFLHRSRANSVQRETHLSSSNNNTHRLIAASCSSKDLCSHRATIPCWCYRVGARSGKHRVSVQHAFLIEHMSHLTPDHRSLHDSCGAQIKSRGAHSSVSNNNGRQAQRPGRLRGFVRVPIERLKLIRRKQKWGGTRGRRSEQRGCAQ